MRRPVDDALRKPRKSRAHDLLGDLCRDEWFEAGREKEGDRAKGCKRGCAATPASSDFLGMKIDDQAERLGLRPAPELAGFFGGGARKGDDLGGLDAVLPPVTRMKHLKFPAFQKRDAQNTVNGGLKLNGSSKEPCTPRKRCHIRDYEPA